MRVDVYVCAGTGGGGYLVFSSTRRGRRCRRSHWARGHPIRLCGWWRRTWVYKEKIMPFQKRSLNKKIYTAQDKCAIQKEQEDRI